MDVESLTVTKAVCFGIGCMIRQIMESTFNDLNRGNDSSFAWRDVAANDGGRFVISTAI